MSSFDAYWDTRIDANHDFFQSNPHIANWAYTEARLAYETGQEKGDSFKLAESERHRQILTQQCMEKNARIAELERQLAELREAVRAEHAAYSNAEACSCPSCMRDFDEAYRRIDAILEHPHD